MRELSYFGVLFLTILFSFSTCSLADPVENREQEYERQRKQLVRTELASTIRDKRLLDALAKIPRHRFIPEAYRRMAYADTALPINNGQTISQPFIVAYMTEALKLEKHMKVLEIGTGSGYQAAVLGELVSKVFTIEILKPLADQAETLLSELGYKNISVRAGDGYKGWPEQSPFDAIILTAAAPEIPAPLLEQLKEGGRLIAPVGDDFQVLVLIEKHKAGNKLQRLMPVRFVPMLGEVRKQE